MVFLDQLIFLQWYTLNMKYVCIKYEISNGVKSNVTSAERV